MHRSTLERSADRSVALKMTRRSAVWVRVFIKGKPTLGGTEKWIFPHTGVKDSPTTTIIFEKTETPFY